MFIGKNYLEPFDYERKYGLFAEGEEGDAGAGGEVVTDAPAADAAAAVDEPARAGADWRDAIKDPDARKFAEDSADLDHFVKRAVDMRKKLSGAIVKPGKDAGEADIAAYRKAMGIPEAPDAYEFPDLPEGVEMSDDIKASREAWAGRFHELGISNDQAKALARMVNEDEQAMKTAMVEADKRYAEEQEAELRKDWQGAEFDKNKTYANRAIADLAERAGVEFDGLRQIETKDGRFLMDNADMLRMFAALGREMGESRLGVVLSDNDKAAAETRIEEVRKGISEAQSRGDSKKANELYQEEQKLISSLKGNQTVVGSQGRAA
jgi:hypothetical protein